MTCQKILLGYSQPTITCTLLIIIYMNFLDLTQSTWGTFILPSDKLLKRFH